MCSNPSLPILHLHCFSLWVCFLNSPYCLSLFLLSPPLLWTHSLSLISTYLSLRVILILPFPYMMLYFCPSLFSFSHVNTLNSVAVKPNRTNNELSLSLSFLCLPAACLYHQRAETTFRLPGPWCSSTPPCIVCSLSPSLSFFPSALFSVLCGVHTLMPPTSAPSSLAHAQTREQMETRCSAVISGFTSSHFFVLFCGVKGCSAVGLIL